MKKIKTALGSTREKLKKKKKKQQKDEDVHLSIKSVDNLYIRCASPKGKLVNKITREIGPSTTPLKMKIEWQKRKKDSLKMSYSAEAMAVACFCLLHLKWSITLIKPSNKLLLLIMLLQGRLEKLLEPVAICCILLQVILQLAHLVQSLLQIHSL